jgi:hypothetical protein
METIKAITEEIKCRCTRCRNEHSHSERVEVEDCGGYVLACPRCFAHSYNDITEYDFKYCTGYPVIDVCPRSKECQLVINCKRDNPDSLSKQRVRHYTKKSLKNCKYFKNINNP